MLRLGPASVQFTGRADGDARLRADSDWRTARQVHGRGVVVVDGNGPWTRPDADALVTAQGGVPLAILTADCAPIALATREGVVAAVHAGWRGLVEGVVGAAVAEMRRLGGTEVMAALGPCIHAECYEFSPADLDSVAAVLGDGVRSFTAEGRPALDVPAAVRLALEGAGAELVYDIDSCTACEGERWYSHRARGDVERQAMVVCRT